MVVEVYWQIMFVLGGGGGMSKSFRS